MPTDRETPSVVGGEQTTAGADLELVAQSPSSGNSVSCRPLPCTGNLLC